MRERISSGSPLEDIAAYSRAIVDDNWLFMSGTMGIDPATGKIAESFPGQAFHAFRIIDETLAKAGFSYADVVHVRLFVADRIHLREIVLKLQEKFSDVKPAQTMIIAQMPAEEALLEVEITAKRQTE